MTVSWNFQAGLRRCISDSLLLEDGERSEFTDQDFFEGTIQENMVFSPIWRIALLQLNGS